MQPPEQSPVFVAALIDGWELVLMLAVALILYGLKKVPEIARAIAGVRKEIDDASEEAGRSLGGIYGKPAAQALTPDNQTSELYDPAAFEQAPHFREGILRKLRRLFATLWRRVLRLIRW